MRKLALFIILGVLATSGISVQAAPAQSDWPSLAYDGTQSNDNVAEHVLGLHNVLKLKVKWTAPDPTASYPIVAGGRVYMPSARGKQVQVRVLDAATGKQKAFFARDALGGQLFAAGELITAGHTLQELDPSTGHSIAQLTGSGDARSTFVAPLTDRRVLLVGHYTGSGVSARAKLLGISPDLSRTIWKISALRAQGTLSGGRVLTELASGGAFFDEGSGKKLSAQPFVHSDWFANSVLNYTVASVKAGAATLYAYDGTGHKVWSSVVGPRLVTEGWPHATSDGAVFLRTLRPVEGVEALDPISGTRLWRQDLPDVEQLVVANGVLYALTYRLGQPVRLVMLNATSGKVIGAILLAAGYYAFSSPNGLMVANGMVFIRAVGPHGPLLLALGL